MTIQEITKLYNELDSAKVAASLYPNDQSIQEKIKALEEQLNRK